MASSTLTVRLVRSQPDEQSAANLLHFDELSNVLRVGRLPGPTKNFWPDAFYRDGVGAAEMVSAGCLSEILDTVVVEGNSAAVLAVSLDRRLTSDFVYSREGLLASSIDALYQQIEAVRTATASAKRITIRVSAVRFFEDNESAINSTDLLTQFKTRQELGNSAGDIPNLNGTSINNSRLVGPIELRASTPQRAFSIAESAFKSQLDGNGGAFVFTLNVYQYEIEKNAIGAETISGGRGQCHFVELGANASTALGAKIIDLLSGSSSSASQSSTLPLCSLTSQLSRDLCRVRRVSKFALLSDRQEYLSESVRILELLSLRSRINVSSTNSLPRLRSLGGLTSNGCWTVTSSSLDLDTTVRQIEPQFSDSEVSVHTVIQRSRHGSSYNSLPRNQLSVSTFSKSISIQSKAADDLESISGSVRQPSLAPMEPLPNSRPIVDKQQEQRSRHTTNSSSSATNLVENKYARLKRFASSRLKKQLELQRTAVWVDPTATMNSHTKEVWIDGPKSQLTSTLLRQRQKPPQQQYWIDGPLADSSNRLERQTKVETNMAVQQHPRNRSLPRIPRPTILRSVETSKLEGGIVENLSTAKAAAPASPFMRHRYNVAAESATLQRLSRVTTGSSDSGNDSGFGAVNGAGEVLLSPPTDSIEKAGILPPSMAPMFAVVPPPSSSASSSGSSGRGSASSLASNAAAEMAALAVQPPPPPASWTNQATPSVNRRGAAATILETTASSLIGDSPSVDELACLESLERQLMGTIASLSLHQRTATRC